MEKIERISRDDAEECLPELVCLLQNALEDGASLGFLPPLPSKVAEQYWRSVFDEVASGRRVLLISRDDKQISGSVQLSLAMKQNAQHRAEVEKLMVHTAFRNRGLAHALLNSLDNVARELHRTLLVLDTEQGSVAEKLYPKCGYTAAGSIPNYAVTAKGSMCSTVVFYKLL